MKKDGKKHILIDARIIGTGTGVYAEGILNQLQKLDSKNNYTVILDPSAKWHTFAPNFKEYRSKNTYRRDISFLRGNVNLAGELYRIKADVFWATFQRIPFFYFKKNTLITIHDLTEVRIDNTKSKADKKEAWKSSKKEVLRDKFRKLPFSLLPKGLLVWILNFFGFRLSVRRSKHIFTPSDFVKKDVAEYFTVDMDHISVTVNGGIVIDHTDKSEAVEKIKDKDFLLYVGTDFAHKNLNILVEVIDLIRDQLPDLHLVFAGRKDRNYMRIVERAKELGLQDRIHVLGFVSAGEKVWLFKNAKLYVFPSLSEGFGIPALEAMAYELPVLASNRTAIPEVCGNAAVYFDPTDKNDIAEKIISTINNEKLKKDLIKKGLERNKLFKWEESAKVVLDEVNRYA